MARFEALILILALVFIGFLFWQVSVVWLMMVMLPPVVGQLFTNRWRWQMMPTYLTLFGLMVAYYWQIELNVIIEIASYVFAILLVLLAGFLTHFMPIAPLAKPHGKYVVGTMNANCERHDGDDVRTLSAKIWYPAHGELVKYKRDGVWSEFYTSNKFPKIMGYLMHYLQNIKTHSYVEMSFGPLERPFPVIVYNHALISIAAENGRLLEELASHGYVVLSVRHDEQDVEYKAVQQGLSVEEKAMDKELLSVLAKDDLSQALRAELTLKQIENSSGMAEIVRRRALDSQFMLDKLVRILSRVGLDDETKVDLQNIGVVGLSVGGAVATQLSRIDGRVKAVMNLDGGVFSAEPLSPINVPYLMVYSELNQGSMDFLKPVAKAGFETQMIAGASHLNYHDAGTLLPIMKFFGALGSVKGERVFSRYAGISVEFFAKQMLRRG